MLFRRGRRNFGTSLSQSDGTERTTAILPGAGAGTGSRKAKAVRERIEAEKKAPLKKLGEKDVAKPPSSTVGQKLRKYLGVKDK